MKTITLHYNGKARQRWDWSDANLARAIKEGNDILHRGEAQEVTVEHPNLFNPFIILKGQVK